MATFRTLDDLKVTGKRVLVRCDLNVPMKDGKVTDATRIERSAQTLKELGNKRAKVIVMSHFGRPKGKTDPEFSLKPLVEPLSKAVGATVHFAADCVGAAAEQAVAQMKDGELLLLENLRFHKEEEENDRNFAKQLAKLADLYVNDAFSAAHRAHASTEALAHLLPAAAGRLMQAELEHLEAALENPARPVLAIVGGAKVSTKLDLLGNLIEKVDALAIGGGMANTFLFAQDKQIGSSLAERDMADTARSILKKAGDRHCKIILPVDAVVAPELKPQAATETVPIESVPAHQKILDVGPRTVEAIVVEMKHSKTVVWNGPVGAFEVPPFDRGTVAVAREAARLTREKKILTVAGGGDTVAALAAAGVEHTFSYVSTAGGAFLEWLEGKNLPGVAALIGAQRDRS